MQLDEPFSLSDWLKIAEKDWSRISNLLEDHDPEAAGFYLQQAVEKFLKAFLLSQGWRLQRIHDLESLLNDAVKYESTFESFRSALQKITAYYLIDRHPPILETGITEEVVKKSLSEIKPLIKSIRAYLTQKNSEPR